jgi:hypothetical protein
VNRHSRETKLKPSDLRAEAQKLIEAGKMPSLFDVIDAIRKTKGDPEFAVPLVQDALMRTKGAKQ